MLTFDVETHLYQLLTQYDIKNRLGLTGDIYLGNDRPQDSYKEDIVLQCLECQFSKDREPTVQERATTGVAQILVYVPDVYVYKGVHGTISLAVYRLGGHHSHSCLLARRQAAPDDPQAKPYTTTRNTPTCSDNCSGNLKKVKGKK